MTDNYEHSLAQAQHALGTVQEVLNRGLAHIKAMSSEGGRISGTKLDEHQLVSYDIALSDAEATAARFMQDYSNNELGRTYSKMLRLPA